MDEQVSPGGYIIPSIVRYCTCTLPQTSRHPLPTAADPKNGLPQKEGQDFQIVGQG
jgi:hypothetical protein